MDPVDQQKALEFLVENAAAVNATLATLATKQELNAFRTEARDLGRNILKRVSLLTVLVDTLTQQNMTQDEEIECLQKCIGQLEKRLPPEQAA